MSSNLCSVVAPYESRTYVTDIWSGFASGRSPKFSGRVTSISVCNQIPQKYAIPNGHKIYLYRTDGDRLYRKISGFGTRITSCEFRSDSRLIIAGEECGNVRICTTDKNTYHLRKLSAHKGIVSGVKFLIDDHRAVSMGADSIVRVWDVALGTPTSHFTVNSGKEATKGLTVGRLNSNLLVCGDLCGNVPIFDVREHKPISTVQVHQGISALALSKSDSKLVIAAGSSIFVWDLIAGKFVAQTSNTTDYKDSSDGSLRLHYKLVTAIAVVEHPEEGEGEVLLSASLDKLVKFTQLDKWKELHEIQCPQPLTAVGATKTCETVIIGGENGFVKVQHLDIKKRISSSGEIVSAQKNTVPALDTETPGGIDPSFLRLASEFSGRWHGGNEYIAMTTDEWLSQPLEFTRRGPRSWLSDGDKLHKAINRVPIIHQDTELSLAIESRYRKPGVDLLRVDHLLRQFSHTGALSAVIRSRIRQRGGSVLPDGKRLRLAVAVVGELVRRGTLSTAVAGRDFRRLSRLLRFIRRNVWRLDMATTCLQLLTCILDVYSPEELADIPEFVEVNRILHCLSCNTRAVVACADHIKRLLTEKLGDKSVEAGVAVAQHDSSISSLYAANRPEKSIKGNRKRGRAPSSYSPNSDPTNASELADNRSKRVRTIASKL